MTTNQESGCTHPDYMRYDFANVVYCAMCNARLPFRVEHGDHPNQDRYIPIKRDEDMP